MGVGVVILQNRGDPSDSNLVEHGSPSLDGSYGNVNSLEQEGSINLFTAVND